MEVLKYYSPNQLLHALLFIIDAYLCLSKMVEEFKEADVTYQAQPPVDHLELSILGPEGQLVGLRNVDLDHRVLIINDNDNNPLTGAYLMIYGYQPEIKAIFYWTTKMQSQFYNQELLDHDIAETS